MKVAASQRTITVELTEHEARCLCRLHGKLSLPLIEKLIGATAGVAAEVFAAVNYTIYDELDNLL